MRKLFNLRICTNGCAEKLNFAGGDPFLYPKLLGSMCQYAKSELGLESVSIISNGSKITKGWLEQYGQYVDVLGVSCDSFNEQVNIEIGRGDGNNVKQLFRISEWCKEFGILFKLNTVVNSYNYTEDMAGIVKDLAPFRWKVFQVLVVQGENDASAQEDERNRRADATKFIITPEQFEVFCAKHRHLDRFVPEPNNLMATSYLILDEFL